MNKENNVIKFPKLHIDPPPQTLEEVSEKIAEYKRSFTDELSEILWNNTLGELARAGVDFDEHGEELFPSMVLLLESIRSLHLQASGIFHPLQDFAESAFEHAIVSSPEEETEIDEE